MKIKSEYIIVAVLLVSTVIFTAFVYIPSSKVNTNIEVVIDTPKVQDEEVLEEDIIREYLDLEEDKTSTYLFEILNRELLKNIWDSKKIYLKYTYLGEYDENTVDIVNDMLLDEYNWKNQLDKDGNVVFGGPLLYKDGTYQLYVHNTMYHAQKYYLLGDVLDMLWSNDDLIGTQIDISGLRLEAVWVEDVHVLEDSTLDNTADLIISTCLERNGDWRLVVGFDVIE